MSLGWVRKSAVEVVADQDLGKGGKTTRQEELRNKSCHPQNCSLGGKYRRYTHYVYELACGVEAVIPHLHHEYSRRVFSLLTRELLQI